MMDPAAPGPARLGPPLRLDVEVEVNYQVVEDRDRFAVPGSRHEGLPPDGLSCGVVEVRVAGGLFDLDAHDFALLVDDYLVEHLSFDL